jgi:hypothetical protein
VVENERREIDRGVRQAVGQTGRWRAAGDGRRVDVGRDRPAMLVWMPASSGGAGSAASGSLRPPAIDDDRAPVAALRDEARVPEPPHELDVGVRDTPGSQPLVLGLPENP